jgi:sensor domain CHASE-containing protein
MPPSVKKTAQFLTRRPLQIVSAPYRHWSAQRLRARQIQEEQRRIAEATNEHLASFHTALWSHWPDAVQHIRQHAQRGDLP